MQGPGVGVGINGNNPQPHAPRRAGNPHRNFAPVGNQNGIKHETTLQLQWYEQKALLTDWMKTAAIYRHFPSI
jgi:hypothetical protein